MKCFLSYNGIQGAKIGYAEVDVKTKYLPLRSTDIEITNDSVLEFESYIEYNFAYEDDGDVSWSYIEVLGADIYNSERDQITIDWLPEGDSIPYVKVTKEKKIVTNNLWLTSFGLPQGDKHYYVFLPNDSVHNILMEQINEKFYKDEDQIAKLN